MRRLTGLAPKLTTAFVILVTTAAGGCDAGDDGADTDDATSDVDTSDGTGDDSSSSDSDLCEPGDMPPACHPQCGSDVVAAVECIDGAWTVPSECRTTPCPSSDQPSCSMFGGEVCCGEDGTVVSALCPTPSQPFCLDGSTPSQSCASIRVSFTSYSETCSGIGDMQTTLSVSNFSSSAIEPKTLRIEDDELPFVDDNNIIEPGDSRDFVCSGSPSGEWDRVPYRITAQLELSDGTSVEGSGELTSGQAYDNCGYYSDPTFSCRPVAD